MYKDGRPNGIGEMIYRNSIIVGNSSFESAQYIGVFSHGKRHGKGSMYWADGSNFRGTWIND